MDSNKISQAKEEEQAVQQFWQQQMLDIDNNEVPNNHPQLPLAEIKKMIRADREFKISAELPIVLGKACEIFIKELALRTWMCTEESKRRTMHICDMARAVERSDFLDFLRGVIPTDDHHISVHGQEDKEDIAEKSAEGAQSYPAGFKDPTMENMGSGSGNSSVE
ncbi:hypothetical protein L6164_006450 [Bauhinia variegata]|uniref:Uncharacterized protein n=1 Tax=Bauhinia variegata TaxID=167791 RepID=A0ACB9PWJ0_BAUVA|nr:hypothetical protein L6164_006450 [Bauhinia variegata]